MGDTSAQRSEDATLQGTLDQQAIERARKLREVQGDQILAARRSVGGGGTEGGTALLRSPDLPPVQQASNFLTRQNPARAGRQFAGTFKRSSFLG